MDGPTRVPSTSVDNFGGQLLLLLLTRIAAAASEHSIDIRPKDSFTAVGHDRAGFVADLVRHISSLAYFGRGQAPIYPERS